MSDPATTIRTVSDVERSTIASLSGVASRSDVVIMLAEREGSPRAVGVLDRAGGPTRPETPMIRIVERDADATIETDIIPLLDALAEAAASLGAVRVLLGWDPMDAPGLKTLETSGFRPTGEMPYFELGPGHVDYVDGYQDATGSTLELVRHLE
jgi:hypothetical protein